MEHDQTHAKSVVPEGAETAKHHPWQRRALLASGALAVVAWVYGAPRLAALWSSPLIYRELDDYEVRNWTGWHRFGLLPVLVRFQLLTR